MWPMQMTFHAVAANLPTEQFMQRERRRLKARHIWEELHLDWPKLPKRLPTKHATGLRWKELYDRLFLSIYTGQVKYKENKYFRMPLLSSPLAISRSWTTWMQLLGDGLHSRSTPLLRSGTQSKVPGCAGLSWCCGVRNGAVCYSMVYSWWYTG